VGKDFGGEVEVFGNDRLGRVSWTCVLVMSLCRVKLKITYPASRLG
jgi:hypothetical protein